MLDSTSVKPAAIGFWQAFGFWLKLGFISFGGPAGQIAIMHEELVVRRRWISAKRFIHALNYCMVLPGPEARLRRHQPAGIFQSIDRPGYQLQRRPPRLQ